MFVRKIFERSLIRAERAHGLSIPEGSPVAFPGLQEGH